MSLIILKYLIPFAAGWLIGTSIYELFTSKGNEQQFKKGMTKAIIGFLLTALIIIKNHL